MEKSINYGQSGTQSEQVTGLYFGQVISKQCRTVRFRTDHKLQISVYCRQPRNTKILKKHIVKNIITHAVENGLLANLILKEVFLFT